jgi:PAS domain S-box-containing protein
VRQWPRVGHGRDARATRGAPAASERLMSVQPNHRIRVLYVADSSSDGDALRCRLQSDAAFHVVLAHTCDELDQLLAPDRFDLVLSELDPWEQPELMIVEKVRARLADLPVVVVTSRGSERWAVEAMKRGAADYIPKAPDYLERLPGQLLQIVRGKREAMHVERQHERLLEQSMALLCIIGFDGFVKRWNPSWNGLLGFTHDEMLAISLRDLVHPDDKSRTAEMARRLRQGKPVSAVEARIRRKDGTYKWILLNAVPCAEQQIYFATGQDITARKEAEEQLRESQERFQLLASATDEAVWDWDLRANRIWRNEGYEKLLGVPNGPADDIIEWWVDRIHPLDRKRVLDLMPPPMIDGRQQWIMEYRLRRADGTFAHVYDRGFVIFNSHSEPVRMVGSIMDISQLKNTEEKLRESEQRFRLVAKATRDAIWDWDLSNGHVWRSEGFQTLFGYKPEEISADLDWWLKRIHEDDLQRVMSQIPSPGPADVKQCMFEYRFRRADGSYADVIDRGFVLFTSDGKPARMIGSIMDVSERRRAEELAHKHRAELAHIARVSTMGEIATGLAHELNQPLTAIANYAESSARVIANRTPGSDEKLLGWIDRIALNTHRAGEIIRRLRGFTRKSEPRRSTVEVGTLVQEVIDLLEAETRLQNIRVRCEGFQAAQATVDPIQIQQVLVNLLRNAFEAMAAKGPERRQVTIFAALGADAVEISVEDQGEGIAAENRERVFDAFFTTKPNGVGIGLAISRSIIEDHGGRLWVTPNPRQGVTFHFTLPLEGAHDVPTAHSVGRR